MMKWPGVPDVYGWLALDRRGEWRVKDSAAGEAGFSRIGNAALRDFIGRNYTCDPDGRYFFQNGPQRVYVRLACTPYVFRFEGASADSALRDQCGGEVIATAAWVDEEGSLYLQSGKLLGLLDDRDLVRAAQAIHEDSLWLAGRALPLGQVDARSLPATFGFDRDPQPAQA